MSGNHSTLLGQDTVYPEHYDPAVLTPIARHRVAHGAVSGEDIWNAFEVSWLRRDQVPQVAIGVFRVPASTPHLIESKSFKLYLNSLNQASFDSVEDVRAVLLQDLTQAAGGAIDVRLSLPDDEGLIEEHACVSPFFLAEHLYSLVSEEGSQDEGSLVCLDSLSLGAAGEELSAGESDVTAEVLFSNLLKTNCPVTGQPDWATVFVAYRGKAIDRVALLAYLVGLRQHQDFHEHCVEQIFARLQSACQPERLLVYARYTRRGGLDINPWRASFAATVPNLRLARQ